MHTDNFVPPGIVRGPLVLAGTLVRVPVHWGNFALPGVVHWPLGIAVAIGLAGLVQLRLAGLVVLAGVPARLAAGIAPAGVAGR